MLPPKAPPGNSENVTAPRGDASRTEPVHHRAIMNSIPMRQPHLLTISDRMRVTRKPDATVMTLAHGTLSS